MTDAEIKQRVAGILLLALDLRDGTAKISPDFDQAALLTDDLATISLTLRSDAAPEEVARLVQTEFQERIKSLVTAFTVATVALAAEHDAEKPEVPSREVLERIALLWAEA